MFPCMLMTSTYNYTGTTPDTPTAEMEFQNDSWNAESEKMNL